MIDRLRAALRYVAGLNKWILGAIAVVVLLLLLGCQTPVEQLNPAVVQHCTAYATPIYVEYARDQESDDPVITVGDPLAIGIPEFSITEAEDTVAVDFTDGPKFVFTTAEFYTMQDCFIRNHANVYRE